MSDLPFCAGTHQSPRFPRSVQYFAPHDEGLTHAYVVAPAELEGHLLGHPDVADCCVVGIPDELSGEIPLAFVVPSHAAEERIKKDPSEADKVKASIAQVR